MRLVKVVAPCGQRNKAGSDDGLNRPCSLAQIGEQKTLPNENGDDTG